MDQKCSKLPPFSRPMRQEFLLDPSFINLNHGSYGTYPRHVQKALHAFQARSEANTDLWMRRDVRIELTKVRQQLAQLVNVKDAEDIVMVPNNTSGINAILRSLVFQQGDQILHFSTTYYAMQRLIQFVSDMSNGTVRPLRFELAYPISNDEMVANLDAFIEKNHGPQNPIRIAIIDHITSAPGILLPVERIIEILRRRNISVLIDGAHAIGQVPINLTQLDPDYYVTNCHKWLYAARGCAMLYVKKKWQESVHPANISAFYQKSGKFQDEFFWTGTIDYSPYMSVTAGLEFRQAAGGEDAICQYTHTLAVEGGKYLAQSLGTSMLQSEDQIANMVDVLLPINDHSDPKFTELFWVNILLDRFNVIACPYTHNGKWFIRASAQIYNDMEDFKECAITFRKICDEINADNNSVN